MKAREFSQLSVDELSARLATMISDYYAMREAVQTGKEKNFAALKQRRADIARVRTVLRQKQASRS